MWWRTVPRGWLRAAGAVSIPRESARDSGIRSWHGEGRGSAWPGAAPISCFPLSSLPVLTISGRSDSRCSLLVQQNPGVGGTGILHPGIHRNPRAPVIISINTRETKPARSDCPRSRLSLAVPRVTHTFPRAPSEGLGWVKWDLLGSP